jgi:transcriptional regulator GlxA family with amidase domain
MSPDEQVRALEALRAAQRFDISASAAPAEQAASSDRTSNRLTSLTPGMSRNRELVDRAEQLVLTNLPRRLTDTALAKIIGATVSELHRAFIDVRRASMYHALYRLRLEAVRRILEEHPTRSLEVVAFECGFGHFGAFNRRYRTFLAEHDRSKAMSADGASPGSDESGPP